MKFFKTLLALFLATGAESKPYQFYGYPETNYQPIYEEFAVQQNDEQDFFMETPYEYAPMIDNTQIISTYTQDHFVQDLGTQEYIVETPDFAYVEDNYVPIVSTYGLQDHYYYDVNPQEYIVETTYPADNSIIEEFAVFDNDQEFPIDFDDSENVDNRGEFVIEADGSTFIGSESDNPAIFGVPSSVFVSPVVSPIAPISSVVQVENQFGVKEDVIEVATENGNFKTLLKIIKDLDLVDTLKEANALTIFAPNDDAFAKLPEGALDDLSNEDKKKIILRHVVIYTIPINELYYGNLNTMGGEDVQIETNNGGHQIKFNDDISNVVTPDVKAKNGVIHVIDKVILWMLAYISYHEFLGHHQKIHDTNFYNIFFYF